MEIMYLCCCGLDIYKKIVVVCVIILEEKEICIFFMMIEDILVMVDWIKSKGCIYVVMESIGFYWKFIYNIFEIEEFNLMVVNVNYIKNVLGRKIDVKDVEWIVGLL